MKRRTSKIFISLLTVLLILTISFVSAFAVESGSCGTNADWTFDPSNGELTIRGSGSMTSYSSADYAPWKTYTDRITKITISEGITKIGNYAFKNCTFASEIVISDGVKEIGYSAFDNCTALKQVALPASVEKINDAPFYNCTALTNITVDSDNKNFSSDSNGVLYNKTKTEIIQYPAGKNTANFSVPDTVTDINSAAFAGNQNIFNIYMSDSVSSIGTMAFYGCTSLSTLTIPENITLIGEMAFSKCDNLSDIYYTGTQDQWDMIAVRDNNSPLLNATFRYESKGPETLSGDAVTTTVVSDKSITKQDNFVQNQLKNNIDLIPAILVGIAVVVFILVIILIRVIFKKRPEKDPD